MKGAEIIAEYLIRERVPYAVGLCGHGDLGLLDALYDRRGEIATLSVHHESAAGFIADAYYRVRHEPLATFTSVGPGSANLPVALGSAFMDSSAFLAITGNVPTTQFNRGPFQETGRYYQADTPGVMRPYVKRSFQATRADQLPLMLRQAFAAMLGGRPGPVHLDVPLDVFVETTAEEVPDPGQWRLGISRRCAAAPADVAAILDLLRDARRPLIVAGYGVQNAGAAGELAAFAAAAQIPVVTSPLGKAVGHSLSPLYLGATGRNGTYQANRAARSADVILALGTRFDDRSTSSWLPGYTYSIPPARLIQVDLDPAELGRNYPVVLGVAANPKDVLGQLRDGLPAALDTCQWLAGIATWVQDWNAIPPRTGRRTPARCGPSGCWPTCAACCPRTGFSSATSASTTTGSCRNGSRSGRARCCRAGASRPCASGWPGCSAPAWRPRTHPRWRWSATAASSCCRAWSPAPSSTASPRCGWSGTTGATSPSATSSGATSAPGGRSRRASVTRPPAAPTPRTTRRWPGPWAPRACGSRPPATSVPR